jgi:two-component system NtrC family response regulator
MKNEGTAIHTLPKLLVVEDDPDIREQMRWAFANHFEIREAGDRTSAVAVMGQEHPELVTLDLGLPPSVDDVTEGLATLEQILAIDPLTKIVVVTGNSERVNALKAVQLGAYDFIHKPIQIDALRVVLERAGYLAALERDNKALEEKQAQGPMEEFLGTSEAMQKVFDMIRRVANTDVSVLVLGESGTGKELAARAIHRQSPRKQGPFVAINCGAIPEALLESELFGHERGAFTGAHAQRKGRIEMAQGGTLFLDEIGELSPPLQVKLLRFLQNNQMERVGGRETVEIDVRVVAATNMDLRKAMQEGKFREDLYYRLCGVEVAIPPLRDRGSDILLLAQAFLSRFSAEAHKKLAGFSRQAQQAIEGYHWPGNVRELENRIQRAVIMAEGRQVTSSDLELESAAPGYAGKSLREAREVLERHMIKSALARHKGNITRAAQELGLTRPTLYEFLTKLGLRDKHSSAVNG